MEGQEIYKDFRCPICGSKEYHSKTKSNGVMGPGYHEWLQHHECNGCGVLFMDPIKFTNAKK